MKRDYANLACGSAYLPGWSNFDYSACPPWVQQCNLLGRIPISKGSCRLVYSSHFLEHIPTTRTAFFLSEIYRILKPGGIARIVTPDFSEMCHSYTSAFQAGDIHKAEFIQLEILDQCVRKVPGGKLGKLYETLASGGSLEAHERSRHLIYYRTGEQLSAKAQSRLTRLQQLQQISTNPKAAFDRLANHLRVKLACWIAPSAFVEQNISQATIGENHAWLYTFAELANLLTDAGFVKPERMSFATSNVPDFPCDLLDMHPDGGPRKGAESMYVEARKPL